VKAVIQRVINASVIAEKQVYGSINTGLIVYLGVAVDDNETDADWIAGKIANLRIFDDADGKMNLSIKEINQEARPGVLAISQFTLLGDVQKGRRPSWSKAAQPEIARQLYEYFINRIRIQGIICENGKFQAYMQVSYTNDGPVTILLDSKTGLP
jgi:D-tyrosyl-tRNA(Tyr) deacylase